MTILPPIPALQRRPFDLAANLTGTFAVFKRGFGTYIALSALALLAIVLPMGLLTAMAVWAAALGAAGRPPVGPIIGVLVSTILIFVGALLSSRFSAMATVATEEIYAQRRPTFATLWERTRGYMGRILVLSLVIGLAVLALYAVLGGIIGGLMWALGPPAPSAPNEGLIGLLVLVGIIVYVALVVAMVWIQTKTLYLIAAMALEGLDGFAGWRRSWSITRGNFWRTLGWYLAGIGVAYVFVYVVSYLLQLAITVPMMLAMQRSATSNDPSQIIWAILPVMGVLFLIEMVVMLLLVPYAQIYITLMFIDQRNRDEMVAAGVPLTGPYGMPRPVPGAWPGYAGPPAGSTYQQDPQQPGLQQPGPHGQQPGGYGGESYGQQQGTYGQGRPPHEWR